MIDIKNKLFVLSIIFAFLMLYGCNSKEIDNQHIEKETNELQKEEDLNLKLYIDDKQVPVIWEDNQSVRSLFII